MPLPKISIVTPSYNQASFIEENIRSVLQQNYPSVEHIVIDGGSNDTTLEILKKYSHLHWISEADRGQSHALNKGFHMATGEIIGWINSDDGYCPNIFRDVAKIFDDPNVIVVYGDGVEIDETGRTLRTITPRGISDKEFIRYWWWRYDYIQAAFFFRREVFERVGYLDEDLYYTMDHEFFIRLLQRYSFTYVPKQLAYYRLHKDSKTGIATQPIIPKSIWELHRVSLRYWGSPVQLQYYINLFSFIGGLLLSFLKNIFFVRGSKMRLSMKRLIENQ